MGSITISGKGSRNRIRDLKTFRSNFDEIKWHNEDKKEPICNRCNGTGTIHMDGGPDIPCTCDSRIKDGP